MNILEKEIEKRQLMINEKATLTDQLKRLQDAIEDTQIRISQIDETVLMAEIAELRSYLEKPVETIESEEEVEE